MKQSVIFLLWPCVVSPSSCHHFLYTEQHPTPTGEVKGMNEFAEWHISGMTCEMA